MWHQDDRWLLPKAVLKLRLSTPHVGDGARARVETSLAVSLVEDNLKERLYDADLAGLSLNVTSTSDAITISVSGYNDKLLNILETVLQDLKSAKLDEDRFRLILDEVDISSSTNKKERC